MSEPKPVYTTYDSQSDEGPLVADGFSTTINAGGWEHQPMLGARHVQINRRDDLKAAPVHTDEEVADYLFGLGGT